MNKNTKIEWVKNPDGTQGYTWNPITGCLNHINGLCKGGNFPCYAYRLAHGRLKSLYLANTNWALDSNGYTMKEGAYYDPFYPRFWPEKVKQMSLYTGLGKRKGIFVCDMSDLFGIGIPDEWTRKVIERIEQLPQHRFYLLTKQPQNLVKFSPFPDNVYLGVTVCNQGMFDKAVGYLKMVDAKVKYLSMEPLLGRINIDF